MKKTLMLLSAAFILFSTSCSKDDDNTDCAETVAGAAGTYKVTKMLVNGTDLYPAMDACTKSGTLVLKADKTLTYTETASCSGDGTGTWDIVGNTITITHSGNGDDFAGTVVNNCSNLQVTEAGGGFTVVTTLSKQ